MEKLSKTNLFLLKKFSQKKGYVKPLNELSDKQFRKRAIISIEKELKGTTASKTTIKKFHNIQRKLIGFDSPKKKIQKKMSLNPLDELVIMCPTTLNKRRQQKRQFLKIAPNLENLAPNHKVKKIIY